LKGVGGDQSRDVGETLEDILQTQLTSNARKGSRRGRRLKKEYWVKGNEPRGSLSQGLEKSGKIPIILEINE